jgi:hypothetical protein
VWVVKATTRPLYPRDWDPLPAVQEAGWTSGLVWTGADSPPPKFDPRTVQTVASRCSTILAHNKKISILKKGTYLIPTNGTCKICSDITWTCCLMTDMFRLLTVILRENSYHKGITLFMSTTFLRLHLRHFRHTGCICPYVACSQVSVSSGRKSVNLFLIGCDDGLSIPSGRANGEH